MADEKQRVRKHHEFLRMLISEENLRVIAEIGIYRGGLCRKLLTQPHNIHEYWAIDRWEVIENSSRQRERSEEWWQDQYIRILRFTLYYPELRVARLESCEAAWKLFPDGYFDLVYIDATHLFDDLVRDLTCWWPKVKIGGYIAGHDYFTEKYHSISRGSDVRFAVDHFFGENQYEIFEKCKVFCKVKN